MKTIKLSIVSGLLAAALIFPGMAARAGDKEDKKHRGDVHIPPGHLPPPGKCRIWYPGTPPGHQPPPGDCRTLSRDLPRGALLVSRDRIWRPDERPADFYHRRYVSKPDWRDDHPYPRYGSDSRKREIRNDIKDVREARKDVREDREQLQKSVDELKKDRAELRRDLRSGASQKEIRQDRREVREDVQKIREGKQDLRQSQNKLEAARGELKDDLRRR